MSRTKKELAEDLDKIESKLKKLVEDFILIKKNAKAIQSNIQIKRNDKKISDLKNKIQLL